MRFSVIDLTLPGWSGQLSSLMINLELSLAENHIISFYSLLRIHVLLKRPVSVNMSSGDRMSVRKSKDVSEH